jgi:hypothetical protein
MIRCDGWLAGWLIICLQGMVCSQWAYSMDLTELKDGSVKMEGPKSHILKRAKVVEQEFELLPENIQEAILFAPAAEIIRASSVGQVRTSLRALNNSKKNRGQLPAHQKEHFWLISENNPAKSVDVLSRQQTLNLWAVMPRFISAQLVPLVELFSGPQIDADKFIKIIQDNRQLANYTDYAGRTIYHIALRFAMEGSADEDWVGFFEKILTDSPVPLNFPVNLKDKFGNSLATYVCCLAFKSERIHLRWLRVAERIIGQSYRQNYQDTTNVFGLTLDAIVQRHLPELMKIKGAYAEQMHWLFDLLPYSIMEALWKDGSCVREKKDRRLEKLDLCLSKLKVFLLQYQTSSNQLLPDDAKQVVQLFLEFYAHFKAVSWSFEENKSPLMRKCLADVQAILGLAYEFLNPNCLMDVLYELAIEHKKESRLKFFFMDLNLRELLDRGVSPCVLIYFVNLLIRSANYSEAIGTIESKGPTVFSKNPDVAHLLIDCMELAQAQGYGLGIAHIVEGIDKAEFGSDFHLVDFGKLLLCLAKYFDPSLHKILTKNQLLISGGLFSNWRLSLFEKDDKHEDHKNSPYSLLGKFDPIVTADQLTEILEAQKDRRSKAFALQYKLSMIQNSNYADFMCSYSLAELERFSEEQFLVLFNDMRQRLKQRHQIIVPAILRFFEKVDAEASSLSNRFIVKILQEFLVLAVEFPGQKFSGCWRKLFSRALHNPHIGKLLRPNLTQTKRVAGCFDYFLLNVADPELLGMFADHFHELWFGSDKDGFVKEYLDKHKSLLDKEKWSTGVRVLLQKFVSYYPNDFYGKTPGKDSFLQSFLAQNGILPVKFFQLYFDLFFKDNTDYNAIGANGNGVLHDVVLASQGCYSEARDFVLGLWYQNGANFNIVNERGNTPLGLAVAQFCTYSKLRPDKWKQQSVVTIGLLLQYGANPYFKVQGGQSTFEYVDSLMKKGGQQSVAIQELQSMLVFRGLGGYLWRRL